ncbi:LytR/AlgR family response regulator transcription factor [Urechidicola croceus]|uniref:DNA-binding response regulator n=1 Tax=Urechidicola croceus TaxID=1850246 RepID=A0A1D8P507_9FLAO|nr:LytTR family DNA-binding domain-containing protein [Urechidicola croceus]AOW19663.1 hypothetical protein LPB138_02750 [Urechidicola croceus]
MIKAIIIDDEQHCIDRILSYCHKYKDSVDIIEVVQTVEGGLESIKNTQIDLLFLDVHIHNQTGFDLLKKIKHINFDIIFTTAYDKYAVQAFKFSAIDYLLKPIDRDDFNQAIEKVIDKSKKEHFDDKVQVLLHNISDGNQQKKISIPTNEGYIFIEVKEIIRCQSDVNYTNIFTKNNQKITVSKTLKTFEKMLEDFNFFRIHNSHLINLSHIKKYTKGKSGYVTMIDNTNLEVSIRRKEKFLEKMI